MTGRRDYRVLLLQGILYGAALQLSSVTTVLPFVCAELGGPLIIAALVVPVYMVGRIMGSLVAPRMVYATGSVRWLLVGIAGGQAVLIVIVALDLLFLPTELAPYPLLVSTALLGVVAGCSIVAFPLVMALLLTPDQQSDLLLRQNGYGAVLMVVISAVSVQALSDDAQGIDDAKLLLAAAAGMMLAATTCLAISSHEVAEPAHPTGMLATLMGGFRYLRENPWLPWFMGVQTIFASVALAPMFFSIYASRTLGLDAGKLDNLLLFIGVGALAGIPFWRLMRNHLDPRGLLVWSAVMTLAAAILCAVCLTRDLLPVVWALGLTLMLITLAGQALTPALLRWIVAHTSDAERVLVLSFNQTIVAIAYIVAGLLLGQLAAYGPAIWPVVVIVAAIIAAALVVARAPRMPAPA